MKTFRGKIAAVTGAASGIGRAVALELARQGTHLCLVDIDEPGLIDVCIRARDSGVSAVPYRCDVADGDQIRQTVGRIEAEHGGIDLLVNNAGIAFYGPTHTMSDELMERIVSVNLLAAMRFTQLFLPSLLAREDTHIVNMCSISGLVASGRSNAYHTTKFGLVGFTQALRAEYVRRGIGVTAVCPGFARTNLYRSCATTRGSVPLPPRWICASPEQIAAATVQAIRRNRRQVVISPLAHVLHQLNRFAPWLLDLVNTFSRKRFFGLRRKREGTASAPASRPAEREPLRLTPASERALSVDAG
jgi:short-subunit dehydrogenase